MKPELTKASSMIVGLDKGRYGIKIVRENGSSYCLSSRIGYGTRSVGSVETGDNPNVYYADGEEWTVLADSPLAKPLDTRGDNYPSSAMNRVLAYHALVGAGFGGQEISIVSGLPFDEYYSNGKPNLTNISASKNSLLEGNIEAASPQVRLPRIVSHNVMSEAVAALIHMKYDFKGYLTPFGKETDGQTVAIVDIGGSTTDIAVMGSDLKQLYFERSGTVKLGALALNERIAARIREAVGTGSEIPVPLIEKSIAEMTFRTATKNTDISGIVKEECGFMVKELFQQFRARFRDAEYVDRVVFVGGGVINLKPYLKEQFGNADFPEAPHLANAAGYVKALKFFTRKEA